MRSNILCRYYIACNYAVKTILRTNSNATIRERIKLAIMQC